MMFTENSYGRALIVFACMGRIAPGMLPYWVGSKVSRPAMPAQKKPRQAVPWRGAIHTVKNGGDGVHLIPIILRIQSAKD
jgi:hypothetical protein